MTDDAPLSYCARQVREGDSDRFLMTLFARAQERESLFALYAFNLDVARIAEAVREPMMGQIRLQWWRERIDEIYAGTPIKGAEVALALGQAIQAHQLPRAPFDALLDAHEEDLATETLPTLADFERYADATGGALTTLALRILGTPDAAALHAGRHIGIASAMAGHLRAAVFHARRGKVFLPRESLGEQGEDDLRAGRASASLADAAKSIAVRAQEHLSVARETFARPPKAALPAVLSAPLTSAYLRRLARVRYDLFSPTLDLAKPRRQMIVAWAAWRGHI